MVVIYLAIWLFDGSVDGLVIYSVVRGLEALTASALAFEKPGTGWFSVHQKYSTSNELVADFSCLLSAPIGLCRTRICRIYKTFF